MKTTVEKYNKLCDMNIINKQNYDINARVEIIIQEVQDLLAKYEKEAREIYWPEATKKGDQ